PWAGSPLPRPGRSRMSPAGDWRRTFLGFQFGDAGHSANSTSPRTENETAVAVSYRTGVHRVERGKSLNIGLRHLDPVGEHKPIDCLTAWRRLQGSLVVVVNPLDP